MPNSCARLWYSSESDVFRYLGRWLSRIARAPNPTTLPRASAEGNMIRSRNRSYTCPERVFERCARPAASSSSSLNPAPREAVRIRSQALGA